MIVRLQGILLQKQAPQIVLEVAGVAFAMDAPMTAIYELPAIGEEAVVHTVLRFRDEQPELFAFSRIEQRKLFLQLIKINGIGPRVALAILSGINISNFVECIKTGDIGYLTTIPGVGRKTAQRLLMEMRDRIDENDIVATAEPVPSSPESEAISALIALGYNANEARSQVQAESGAGLDSQALIRAALKRFARK